MAKGWRLVLLSFLVSLFSSSMAFAQTTTAFTYQGRLTDGGTQPTNTYAMEFRLFASPAGDDQIGTPLTFDGVGTHPAPVPVANGVFTVQLDFGGATAFDGGARWLQIAVKKPTDSSFVTLTPRQPITSTPYAITATNSSQLNGKAASEYVLTHRFAHDDARPPLSGSDNYIQNGTAQQSGDFNIGGSGTVAGTLSGSIVNATTQFNLGGGRILTAPGTNNLFVGAAAGSGNTGSSNTFVGANAGGTNITGSNNTAIGAAAALTSPALSFATAIGAGAKAIVSNEIMLGRIAGQDEVFIPGSATVNNHLAVDSVGANSLEATTLTSIKLGVGSFTAPTQTLQVTGNGTISGKVGIGTTSPEQTLHVNGLGVLSTGSGAGFVFRDRGSTSANDDWLWYSTGNVARFRRANDPNPGDLFTISSTGVVQLFGLGSAGGVALCFNPGNQISLCSSSIRYKNNINNFSSGLDLIRRLRPVSFNWKANNQADMGLVAEEVADVEPLLVIHNDKGEVEGVKYDRVGVVLINAVKEQQAQIEDQRTLIRSQQQLLETQQRQIEQQQRQVDALKTHVCSMKASAGICKKEQ